jgi:hypothetical protein
MHHHQLLKGGHAHFLFFRKSKNSNFFGLFRNRKSANFCGVPFRKSQFHFEIINPQIRKFPSRQNQQIC